MRRPSPKSPSLLAHLERCRTNRPLTDAQQKRVEQLEKQARRIPATRVLPVRA